MISRILRPEVQVDPGGNRLLTIGLFFEEGLVPFAGLQGPGRGVRRLEAEALNAANEPADMRTAPAWVVAVVLGHAPVKIFPRQNAGLMDTEEVLEICQVPQLACNGGELGAGA